MSTTKKTCVVQPRRQGFLCDGPERDCSVRDATTVGHVPAVGQGFRFKLAPEEQLQVELLLQQVAVDVAQEQR